MRYDVAIGYLSELVNLIAVRPDRNMTTIPYLTGI